MGTAEAMKVHQAIVEKDFWVCWILDYLFQESPWKDDLAFKGGTSLSKGYGAIERFSEDIDLILDWKILGYSDEEPWRERSTTQQDKFCKVVVKRTVDYLRNEFATALTPALAERIDAGAAGAAAAAAAAAARGMTVSNSQGDSDSGGGAGAGADRDEEVGGINVEVSADGEALLVRYPRAFSLEAIQPEIRLEIGPLSEAVPNELRAISPFAAQVFPEIFTQRSTSVTTIRAERTFWEKATILHQEAHRSIERPLPRRYSRHYYDLYRLSCLPIRSSALRQMDLLKQVVEFKSKFYYCSWAKFGDAKPGTLKLLPPAHYKADLERDYQSMRAMLFGSVPSFEDIINGLKALEEEINQLPGF